MTPSLSIDQERLAAAPPVPHRPAEPAPGRVRFDIQALRAAAVALVVLNHLWPASLKGGYIGVDVFFVISGYLITSHLAREITATGRVRLVRFWARRARRLLPAAMTVLLFSVLISCVWLPITNREGAFDQIGAAGTYALNWMLAASSLDYFAQGSALSPVTHYWSLSVEEQFYIVWPVLLLVAALATHRASPRLRTIALLTVMTVVGAASFLWARHGVATEPSAAYFETTTRAWEFAVGGLVAFVPRVRTAASRLIIPMVWLAWGTIAASSYLYGPGSAIPGAKALGPVLAAAAILWAGDIDHRWAPHRWTRLAPVQVLGNLSYSVYLWHWPLIIAAPFVLHHEIRVADKIGIVAITLALANLSKRYIEDPVRRAQLPALARPRNALLLTAAAIASLLLITVPLSNSVGAQARATAASLYQQSLDPARCFGAQAGLTGMSCPHSHELDDPYTVLGAWGVQNANVSNGAACQQVRGDASILACSFGVPEGQQTVNVALVGDSHAGMWSTALDEVAAARGLRVTTYLNSSCAVTADPELVGAPDAVPAHQASCKAWREKVIDRIAGDPNVDAVVTSAQSRVYRTVRGSADDGSGYADAWRRWLRAGKRVVAIEDVPMQAGPVPECVAAATNSVDSCTVPASMFAKPSPLRLAAERMTSPHFTYVDYSRVFCDTRCHSVVGGIPAYLDAEHLTAAFARSFGQRFLAGVVL